MARSILCFLKPFQSYWIRTLTAGYLISLLSPDSCFNLVTPPWKQRTPTQWQRLLWALRNTVVNPDRAQCPLDTDWTPAHCLLGWPYSQVPILPNHLPNSPSGDVTCLWASLRGLSGIEIRDDCVKEQNSLGISVVQNRCEVGEIEV